MKNRVRRLSIIALLVAYLLLTGFLAYQIVFSMPGQMADLAAQSQGDPATMRELVRNYGNTILIVMVIQVGAILTALVLLFSLTRGKDGGAEVVYVEKYADRKVEGAQTVVQGQQQQWEARLAEIRQLAARTDVVIDKPGLILRQVCQALQAVAGALYTVQGQAGTIFAEFSAGYAYAPEEPLCYQVGEGLVGQVLGSGQTSLIADVPTPELGAESGLGKAGAAHLLTLPVGTWPELSAVVQVATFSPLTPSAVQFAEQACAYLAASWPVSERAASEV
ncbi:MAG: hypothetical protein MUC97_06735 [Bernardetiaceae bacterium]|jgi:hypothetical protein|nr:hypothetical protein [Bernardetiaceae bacterium]